MTTQHNWWANHSTYGDCAKLNRPVKTYFVIHVFEEPTYFETADVWVDEFLCQGHVFFEWNVFKFFESRLENWYWRNFTQDLICSACPTGTCFCVRLCVWQLLNRRSDRASERHVYLLLLFLFRCQGSVNNPADVWISNFFLSQFNGFFWGLMGRVRLIKFYFSSWSVFDLYFSECVLHFYSFIMF